MKITLITPAIGKEPGKPYIRSWQQMEPLTAATLKGMTPARHAVEFFDDRIELVDYDTDTDLVAISVETYTARRSYEIARRFRERGIPVVMGGYHVNSIPAEAAPHADALVLGNAERVWETLLADAEKGNLKKNYTGPLGYDDSIPDRSVYGDRKYSILGLVETGRGCVFNCTFCSISACYNARYYPRPVEAVVRDIKASGKRAFFFIDDNIVSNQAYTLELCKALAPLGIKWSSQGSLTMAKNPELLAWLKRSGCEMLLVGIESLDEANLEQMKKAWSYKMGERDDLIERIHRAGISIYATFVFGMDHDTPQTFRRAVDFCMKHGFYFAAFNHVTPFPGTPLYEQLKREKRLFTEKWWLDPNYRYGELAYQPRGMAPDEVMACCDEVRREFYGTGAIMKRWARLLGRNKSPILSYIYLVSNFMMERDVIVRENLPMGDGLDEMPK